MATGRLVLVATPIGNLGDLSDRARAALADADLWIVEDTRISGKLQAHLGLHKPMKVLNDHTGEAAIDRYFADIEAGSHVALLTDGGTPAISDPGALLTDRCLDAGLEVDAVPGPSAVAAALTLSGFFAQRYAFLGFLSRKPGPMAAELAPFADSPITLVVFESPFRVGKLLETAHKALGARRYAVCRELTKAFQQVYRARLPYIPTEAEVPRKGEITVVIEGRRKGGLDD